MAMRRRRRSSKSSTTRSAGSPDHVEACLIEVARIELAANQNRK
jgi:hypothetical protein